LPDNLERVIFAGDLSVLSREFTVFVGYRLEDGTIIYNGNQPIQINIPYPNHTSPSHAAMSRANDSA